MSLSLSSSSLKRKAVPSPQQQKKICVEDDAILTSNKLTESMAASFRDMGQALTCSLCKHVIVQAQTLSACAHSFCLVCIDHYACNNWKCPVPGCGQSLALRGNRKGKGFHCTNPSLETLASSWMAIHQVLERAAPEWWKDDTDVFERSKDESHRDKLDYHDDSNYSSKQESNRNNAHVTTRTRETSVAAASAAVDTVTGVHHKKYNTNEEDEDDWIDFDFQLPTNNNQESDDDQSINLLA
mmetsp:Transcript_2833/g.3807  ORF Transcript_2833/g.3807 Transcript_2833/m.3807 type:complete len:241 (+) Transcript_2833:137-859(+)